MRHALLSGFLMMVGGLTALGDDPQTSLTVENPQTAGIAMFRSLWDTPVVLTADGALTVTDAKVTDRGGAAHWKDGKGAIAFDALDRSLLVRFPDAADKIAAALAKGQTISKIELELPFRDEELWPPGSTSGIPSDGYNYRVNWGVDEMFRGWRPQWHAVAWALRRPWNADATTGPTSNAAAMATVYWSRFGATDTDHDRFPTRYGPAEVSYKKSRWPG